MMSSISFELIPLNAKYRSVFAVESIRDMQTVYQIPSVYISHIEVNQLNGATYLLDGADLKEPLVIDGKEFSHFYNHPIDDIRHIRVFIDVEDLEFKVDSGVSLIFESCFK